ncbi:MAG: hypothetical protein B1H12_09125 [Desulfobacteraceae bacterium 4484_190.2]|nr:MAG: hypothetical protein B1H12_09125 [Desulfobacteraceae bacterium 4484_190.2]
MKFKLTFINLKKDKRWLDDIAIVTQVGLTMAGSILFCLAIGLLLDKWLGFRGLFSIIFILLGIVGGGVTVYRQIGNVVNIKSKKDINKRDL